MIFTGTRSSLGPSETLYESLHCYVRGELNKEYGDSIAPTTGPILHIYSAMWAQQWGNVYDLVAQTMPTQVTMSLNYWQKWL